MLSDEERLEALESDVNETKNKVKELETRAEYTATREDVEKAKFEVMRTAIAVAAISVVAIGAIVAISSQ